MEDGHRRTRLSRSPSPRRNRSLSPRRNRSPSPRRDRSPSPAKGDDASNPGNNLYITGLSTRVVEKDLTAHLSREGKVAECRIVVDPRTKESRGFGFVVMASTEDAERCIKYLNRSTLEGRIITIEKAKRKRGRTPTPGQYLGVRALPRSRPPPGYPPRYRDERDYRDYRDRDYSRRSPRYSPYRGERSPPRYSPGRYYRRERSRSPYYHPYRR